MKLKIPKPKIYISTDIRASNIISLKNKIKSLLISQYKDLKKNSFKDENFNPNLVQNNNLNKYLSKNQSCKLYKRKNNEQNISKVNVLFPKEGYGNSEDIQNKLKKRKKKKILERNKAYKESNSQQHFKKDILKNPEEIQFFKIYQQYQLQPSIFQNQKINIRQYLNEYFTKKNNINQNIKDKNNLKINQKNSKSIQEKKVPPVLNIYPNSSNFMCNIEQKYLNQPLNYQKKLSDNLISLQSYSNEEQYNSSNICGSTQNQTFINITPMTTIDESNTSFKENKENVGNEKIYRGNKRIKRFRTLSPINYDNIVRP